MRNLRYSWSKEIWALQETLTSLKTPTLVHFYELKLKEVFLRWQLKKNRTSDVCDLKIKPTHKNVATFPPTTRIILEKDIKKTFLK